MRTNGKKGQTDMTKVIGDFRGHAKAPEMDINA